MKNFYLSIFLSLLFNFPFQAQVYINEIVYDPIAPNSDGGSSSGEWVELYATTTTDISCLILTDGDWTVTIPSGTTLAAGNYYTIGKASIANTPGGDGTTPIDLDVETCNCTNGISAMMELTNSGEFVGLFDPVSNPPTFVDGLLFEGPSAGNTPEGEVSIEATANASIGCATSVTIDLFNTASSYTDTGTPSGTTAGVARSTNGTGSWVYFIASDATPGASNSPLPVEFISFDVKISNDKAILTWQTATELNNDYFSIEHSDNGELFEVVGRRMGAGTISTVQEYGFTLENLKEGIHYFRLNQVDFDGMSEYSSIITAKIFDEDGFQVYPTIVTEQFTIENNEGFKKNTLFEVFDISGKKIQSGTLPENETQVQICTADWSRGHFMIQIQKNGESVVKRIVK